MLTNNSKLLAHSGHSFKQECIPVGCVPPALYCTGGLPDRDPPAWTETLLDRDPLNRITDRCKNITFP